MMSHSIQLMLEFYSFSEYAEHHVEFDTRNTHDRTDAGRL